MEFLFADYTQKTEALVTGVRLQNEAFDIYELQLLGLDKNNSCSYTNSGTATRTIVLAIASMGPRLYF